MNASSRIGALKIILCAFCLTLIGASPLKANNKQQELTFGVFPYLSPRIIEKIYSPISEKFSEVLEQDIQFLTSSSYRKFMGNLDKQMYDIVFVQPFDYVMIADKYGYKPLAVRNEKLPAVLVVKPGSAVKSLSHLKGGVIGLPPKVAAISYLIKRHLRANGLIIGKTIKVKHFRSHFSCMHNVVIGSVAACGTAPPAVRVFQSKMKRKLRIVAKTKGIPNSLFAIHPRVSKEKVAKLKASITSWHKFKGCRSLLTGAKVSSFATIEDSQYDEVRMMAKEIRN